jgi:cytochrome P450
MGELDLLDPGFLADPYPVYHRLPGGRSTGEDVIEDLAYPLPVTVISELLGVPAGDADQVREWSRDVARALDAIALPVEPDVLDPGGRLNGQDV